MSDKNDVEKILQKDRQERVKRCYEKIQKILEEEKCVLDVSVIIKQNQIIPQVTIVSKI